MNDRIESKFRPRWARSENRELLETIEETPFTGSLPLESPKIITRLLPKNKSNSFSASLLSEVIELTQKLANYAAYDVIKGYNPDFTDLRSLGADVFTFSQLTVEPFESGSFLIPARFEADDFTGPSDNGKPVHVENVAQRFSEILERISTEQSPTDVSFGALQTVKQLNRTLRKEAEVIEYTTFGRFDNRISKTNIDSDFIHRIDNVIKKRQSSGNSLESLDGTVTALDISKEELQLTVRNQKQRVRGTFHVMLHPILLESLGKPVRLFGRVNYSRRGIESISIQQAEPLETD